MPSNEDIREGRKIEKELRLNAFVAGYAAFSEGLDVKDHKYGAWWDSWEGGWRTSARDAGAHSCTVQFGLNHSCGVCRMKAETGQ
jgi:hypothetical protein